MSDLKKLAKRLMTLDDRIIACMKCGMCQAVCPMFGATMMEADVARGKLALVDNLAHEMIADPEAVADKLGRCLLCGSCEANCPSGVKIMDIFMEAREIVNTYLGLHPVKKMVFRALLPYPGLFNFAMRVGAPMQRVIFRSNKDTQNTACAPMLNFMLGDRHIRSLALKPLHAIYGNLDEPRVMGGLKVAFFPGTFDPFTLSHKGIVHAIRDLGFEVYLAVDEFSWSKKAQPHLIRRQIVNLSVAGDFHVHLFPDDIPVNIANPADLKRLRKLFPGQEVYLVVGSDVVGNASSFQEPPRPWSIHSMNLIIFRRAGQPPLPSTEQLNLKGDVIQLQLPPHLEDISSTRIREQRGHEPGHLHLHRPGDPGLHLSERPVPPRHQDKPCSRPGPVLPVGGAAGPPCWWPMSLLAPGAGEPADRYPSGRGPAAGAAPPSGGRGAHAGLAQLPLSVYSRPLLRVSKRRSGGPGAPAGGR